jgi:hypothetical protein
VADVVVEKDVDDLGGVSLLGHCRERRRRRRKRRRSGICISSC